jgi:protein involved in polysaccharide export with SLBB domain
LAQIIEQRLSKYHRNPSVRVHISDPNKYFVDGEVNHPGSFCLDTPTTVLEALDISGGLRKQANPKRIRIVRGTAVLRFNYKDVRNGKHPEQNILIEKGDHVIVTRSY